MRITGKYGLALALALAVGGCGGGGRPGESSGALTPVVLGSYHIEAVTSDGWAVVSDLKAHTVVGVNLAKPSMPVPILSAPLTGMPWGSTVGWTNAVLLQHDATMTGVQLTLWTSSGGAKLLSKNASAAWNDARMLRDGSLVAFWDHVDATTDGLTIYTVATGTSTVIYKASNTCTGGIQFAGTDTVVASYCTTAATPVNQVASFNLTSGTTTVLQDKARFNFQVDPTGHRVMVRANAGGPATLVAIDGSRRDALDANLAFPDGYGSGGQWFNDGVEYMFATTDGTLKRICDGGQAMVVAPSGVANLLWMSPDNTVAAYATTEDTTNSLSDIWLASTVLESAPIPVNVDGSARFTGYTFDSKHALFYNAADPVAGVGTFTTVPVSGGHGRVVGSGGSKLWADAQLGGTRTSQTLLTDHYVAASGSVPEHGSIEVVDLATTNAPTALAQNADLAFGLTADSATLVYTLSMDPASAGLYTAAIP
jgi:hypothetical protein